MRSYAHRRVSEKIMHIEYGRKRNCKTRTLNKTPAASENQTDISKFLVNQEGNTQSNYNRRLAEVSVPLLDDTSLSCYPNLSSTSSKTVKVSSACKENRISSCENYDEQIINNSNKNNSADPNFKDRYQKKSRKEITLFQNRLTDYFPVRRSSRKSSLNAKKEIQSIVEDAILSGKEEGFEVKEFPGKGRGVITKRPIKRGDFVLEYYGELIDYEEAKQREAVYATKESTGCYMYYFMFRNKRFCVDATKETNRLGRLVNHSKKGNLKTQAFLIKDHPHLALLAGRDIEPGEELSYDYGDRRKIALESHPWLAL